MKNEDKLTTEEALFIALDIAQPPSPEDLWYPHYVKALEVAKSLGYKR